VVFSGQTPWTRVAHVLNFIAGADGGQTLNGTAGADLIYGYDPYGPSAQAADIAATRIASGLSSPLYVTAAPDDPNRIFVVEKGGRIKIIDIARAESGAVEVVDTPFLDVSAEISTAGESGLLGLAFDPNYAQNGYFYVNLINTDGNTEIRRYQVSANPDVADPESARLVISIDQPAGVTNHKAGWLDFGPDGYLYAALGDGGGGGDPLGNGQNIDTLLGAMLRLDVHGDDFPGDPTRNYAVPPDNPFVGAPGADEIWAYGLRNPWRNSFDRVTGEFVIADVGQNRWEEINLGEAGANYGWNLFEGPDPYLQGASDEGLTPPIFSYGRSIGSSITGGYVYRGQGEHLHGQYFYGDFVTAFIATLQFVDGGWSSTTREVQTDVGTVNLISSFGEDARGNLYVVDYGGEVFRLTPTGVSNDGDDIINAGDGDDWVFAGAGNDTVYGGAGDDTLNGMDGDDLLFGEEGHDWLDGGDGDDFLDGGLGDDILIGGAGNDTLIGGAGDDQLFGGIGSDILLGGPGDDTYHVDDAFDLVDEGYVFPDAGFGGFNTIISTAN
jgi:Ca2+-binding RTX toxin-like protein